MQDETVDLIYLDPPFNSNADYSVLFTAKSARGHRAQIQAFEDFWRWGDEAEEALDEIRARGGSCAAIVRALREALGPTDMMAYIVMMAVRLIEMHRVLRATGSLYLHCDPTASHYLKLILDSIFGKHNYINEISWRRTTAKADYQQGAKHFPRTRDIIYRYCKDSSSEYIYNQTFRPYDASYIASKYRHRDLDGRLYRLDNLTGPGGASKGNAFYSVMGVERHWRYSRDKMQSLIEDGRIIQTRPGTVPQYKRYLDEMPGVPVSDDWDDIRPVNSQAHERLGYPTQKPVALLERIIETSSNPGDVVLDPFCGCGTAVHAAQKLQRKWIGVDITHLAIHVIADRLSRWMPLARFKIYGQPRDVAGAQALADLDKYQFQWWATWLAGGQPHGGGKKGADGGIDGTLEFATGRGEQNWGVVSVKGGKNVGVDMVRQLDAVIRNEGAAMGVLVTMAEPTREMERWAVTAGHVVLGNVRYRRIQIRTIEQLLAGQAIDAPHLLTTVQEAPAKSTRGAGNKVALSPADALAQRNMLLAITGGKAAGRQGALDLDEPALVSPRALDAVKLSRTRRSA
ncbi:site-specific DNA-methyltransferase [Methylobacterium haplocladii]|uniref:site-specific DNA-methyltransferase n=1 Tax=Methylobacterium haplocladii TaxID=1176176 RepID=UPI001EDF42A4|nr:site-specific DNA-methyltransferase [Methylobacterium haplocladii]